MFNRHHVAKLRKLVPDVLFLSNLILLQFRDRVFWLGHNMDFRGRVYPLCPHLQHMSNDMSRSLLSFAKGEKLGPDGLDWLKVKTKYKMFCYFTC